jgi:hypothetical protein
VRAGRGVETNYVSRAASQLRVSSYPSRRTSDLCEGADGAQLIQVTADIYGHLIAGADIAWADNLDAGQQLRKYLQPRRNRKKTNETTNLRNLKRLVGPQGFEPWTNGL